MGARITRLQYSLEQMQAAKRYLPEECLREVFAEIEANHSAAVKENKLIYQAHIGDVHTLPAVPRATLVKAIAPTSPLNSGFKDVFSSVISTDALRTVQDFDRMKNERLKMETDRLNEHTELMEGIVASLGISEEMSTIPGSVKRHSAEVLFIAIYLNAHTLHCRYIF
ncbi:unnamed protein product [Strongylus vulgaris]|uniref:BRO1 domain-containing protein n=1 Tax=Strongylus vulgaris TaxID=40348 RepID=A0A3P7ITS8_STRVU|nr:unnamed protein product [Strongylus vulgaris]